MKSILYGIGTLHIGGTEKHLIDVIRNLSKKKRLQNFNFFIISKWKINQRNTKKC